MSLKDLVPSSVRSAYHLCVALTGAALFGFPSRRIRVIGVTGTKGKTTTTEMISVILEASGQRTAIINSIRTKIGDKKERNLSGRSMPGRARLQRFLRQAVKARCTYAIIEMTSEGARQHRHRGIELDALIFLNLAPEHIESHGTYEAYSDAKFALGLALADSPKRPRIVIANADDKESARYLALPVESRIAFSLTKQQPWHASERGGSFTYEGATIEVPLPGEFSLKNALAAAEACYAFGAGIDAITKGLGALTRVPGRAERIDEGQDFEVVVDYAHTPDSLKALFDAYGERRKICVLGSAGGGRDTWKRPVIGALAEQRCEIVIISNDEPMGEDPEKIAREITGGMKRPPTILLDRRDAVRRAITSARSGDVVLLTGMGISPVCDAAGTSTGMTDADLARRALREKSVAQV